MVVFIAFDLFAVKGVFDVPENRRNPFNPPSVIKGGSGESTLI